ncbi:MAG: hypothetical protein HC834_06995, partial [Rhodospirillales bacterium]|nr:hypothetical protein [Rhodospirillales bacterium]
GPQAWARRSKGFRKLPKEFESEFKKEAERIRKKSSKDPPMQAKIELPEPKALATASTSAESPAAEAATDTEVIEEPS